MPDNRIEEAHRLYLSGYATKAIAERFDVSPSTVRSWKSRYKWGTPQAMTPVKRTPKKNATQRKERNATQPVAKKKKNVAPKKKNAIPNNARPGNTNAVTHGLFQKHLPPEALEITEELKNASALDLIWDQILISYTAIIRAQRIMFVEDADDHSRAMTSDGETTVTYSVKFAADKQATFLQAQAKAQSQLQSLIRQYQRMVLEDPYATEEQEARINLILTQTQKLKSEIARAEGDDEELSKLDRLLEGLDDQSNR